jgi:hypothetical protein
MPGDASAKRSKTMPIETAVAVSAIMAPFVIFVVVLAWGEIQTRGISR